MKIAISGASGFIGRYLTAELLKNGQDNLFLYTRSLNHLKNIFPDNKRIHLIATDYSKESLENQFDNYDVFIHLAAKVFNKDRNDRKYYNDNIKISQNIFETCAKYKVRNIINISTRMIYENNHSDLPLLEKGKVKPESPYAKSKYGVENLAVRYNLNIKSLRLSIIYGIGQREGFMMPIFIENAIKKRPITVFGSDKMEHLYVKDAVSAIICAMMTPKARGIYNIGGGKSYNPTEIAQLSVEIFDDRAAEIYIDELAYKKGKNYQMNIDKAKKELNWTSRYSMRDAFTEMKKLMKLY